MSLLTTQHKLESKDVFRKKIQDYFSRLAAGQIPTDIVNTIVDKVTDYQYDLNSRFWKQYPKSRKRYFELKLDDLNHPDIYRLIVRQLKPLDEYRDYAKRLLQKTEVELEQFEVWMHQFETK